MQLWRVRTQIRILLELGVLIYLSQPKAVRVVVAVAVLALHIRVKDLNR
jgi:hypothetical protein